MTTQREIKYIDLEDLKLSPVNVRKIKDSDRASLKASIAANGVIQSLLVRPNCEGFEVVAGEQRYLSSAELAEETGKSDPLPCIILDSKDDAAAIEASLAENIARLPMDEFDQYHAFAALHKEGRSVEGIAASFGVTERMVKQRLALANLDPAIVQAYRDEEIDVADIRLLTMATKRQQKAWLKLYNDDQEETPWGRYLKAWLFGGQDIPASNALFDPKEYKGAIKSDLFSEERYFCDHTKFWKAQNAAIAARQQAYLEDGWSEVVILDIGKCFCLYYDHRKWPKEKGGRVYVQSSADGETTFHEGYVTRKEAQKLERAEAKEKAKEDGAASDKAVRPELTKAAQNYLDLHRHNAVRNELLKHPSVALRLMRSPESSG